jgi:hypothetical protein
LKTKPLHELGIKQIIGLIGAMVKSGTYIASCAGTGRERCEHSKELVTGMNIQLELDGLYAYGARY